MKKILASIRAGVSRAWTRIKRQSSAAWLFLRPIVGQALTRSGIILADIARQVVADIEATVRDGESGAVKREMALERMQTQLKDVGMELATSVVSTAIEAAVTELRRKAGK